MPRKGPNKAKAHSRRPHVAFEPRVKPLELSNPFKHTKRKNAFNGAVNVLSTRFPNASLDWVRKQAWKTARAVEV